MLPVGLLFAFACLTLERASAFNKCYVCLVYEDHCPAPVKQFDCSEGPPVDALNEPILESDQGCYSFTMKKANGHKKTLKTCANKHAKEVCEMAREQKKSGYHCNFCQYDLCNSAEVNERRAFAVLSASLLMYFCLW